MSYLFQLVVSGVVVGSIYALSALGFVLIYKSSRVLNIAHGQIIAGGAFITYALTVYVGIPLVLSFFISMILTFLLSMAVERVFLRRLIGEPIISVIMVTIGMSVVLRGLTLWIFGAEPKSYPPLMASTTTRIAGLNIETIYLWSTVVAVLGMAAFALFFKYSRLGLAMRATAFNQQVAQSLGVSIKRIFLVSWAISALVSGVAGVVIGIVSGVSPGLT
ncbi:MAG: branched-chain amino acid ABC transporter permease, partial [Proteobacteria bacterium]|nr:branched-chain amino acid ABC transporter permease [Pseudomonadota bacterium]